MLGFKKREFSPLGNQSLEAFVPQDHFYRQVEHSLDLAFVRDLVRELYASDGRPSIDPVVFFRLQLVMFFEGIRSERQLLRVAADRLSVRWYLGYDLSEPLPDHSSLTRIRDRYGLEVFRRFFEAIVDQCQKAGLVWGKELYFDGTQVDANASLDSLQPRFAVESHLQKLFGSVESGEVVATSPATGNPDMPAPQGEARIAIPLNAEMALSGDPPPMVLNPLPAVPVALPVPLSVQTRQALEETNGQRHDWLTEDGQPDRTVKHGRYQRQSDFVASSTDPDAALMQRKQGGVHFGYHDHYVVDGGKDRIIVEVLVTPADVMENQPMLDLLWRTCFRWKLRPRQVTGDTTYGTIENIVSIEDAGIRAYVPLPDLDARTHLYGPSRFRYDLERDEYRCPQDRPLHRHTIKYTEEVVAYRAAAADCNACPVKVSCTTGENGRLIHRSFYADYIERVHGYHAAPAYQKAIGKRKVWVEPLFAEAKEWHGLRRFRLRRLRKVNSEALLTATGQNIKRLLSRRGWGRRPFPSGAPGLRLARAA